MPNINDKDKQEIEVVKRNLMASATTLQNLLDPANHPATLLPKLRQYCKREVSCE